MATGKMYAWNNFPVEVNEYGQPTKTIKVGDAVSQSDLDVSDEDWEEYIATGAVREEEYPDVPADVSPAEYQKQMDNAKVELVEAQAAIDAMAEAGVEPLAEGEDVRSRTDTPKATQPAAATAAAKDK
jgi:hypothetical protein